MEKCFKRINLENATREDVLNAILDLIKTCESPSFVFSIPEAELIQRFTERYTHFTEEHNILLFPWGFCLGTGEVSYKGYPSEVLEKIFIHKGQSLTREELNWLLTEKFDLKLTGDEIKKNNLRRTKARQLVK